MWDGADSPAGAAMVDTTTSTEVQTLDAQTSVIASQGIREAESAQDYGLSRIRKARHTGNLHVVVGIDTLQLALPCGMVREMLQMPRVSVVPGAPPYVRGVVNLRGEVLPIVDLRLRLGFPPYGADAVEFVRLMEERAEDHRRWLAELETCVAENRKFTLATDPRQCAFGRWYAEFRTENAMLSSLLRSFDVPHRQIHEMAAMAQSLVDQNRRDEAMALVRTAHSTVLARLLQLFDRVANVVRESQREMAVVITMPGGRRVAISVDEVRAVEPVDTEMQVGEAARTETNDPLVGPTVRRQNDLGLVCLLQVEHLLDSFDCREPSGSDDQDVGEAA
jgi:purine-binding chemotaxis protein CheW